ncbi:MAG: lysyl oxidase family protein [Nocardioides sp.]
MGSSGRRIGLSVVVLAVAAGAAVTVAMAAREPAAPDPKVPTEGSSTSSAGPGQLAGPPALLPNLRSLDAADLQVQRVPGGRLLRFSASLANLGPGPLLMQPRPEGGGCPRRQHPAVQVLHRDVNQDGAYQPEQDAPGPVRDAGCMLAHPTHDHWHFDAMAGYSLRSPTTGQRLATRGKVSFCLRDNRRIDGVETSVRREHFGECTRTGPQGISPGWQDAYLWDLPGQTLPLPAGLGRRVLCLALTADPRDLLAETDETDNGTAITVVVTDNVVQLGPPGRCDPA